MMRWYRLLSGLLAIVWLAVLAPSAWAAFGLITGSEGFSVKIQNEDGTVDTQAGSHPFSYTIRSAVNTEPREGGDPPAGGDVKDVEAELPAGFVGDPSSVPQCPLAKFRQETFGNVLGYVETCPASTQVGIAHMTLDGSYKLNPQIYNLMPQHGYPAEFGFRALGIPVVFVPRVRTGKDYGVTVSFNTIPDAFALTAGEVTLWGVPGAKGHNHERGPCWGQSGYESNTPAGGECPTNAVERPFLSLPTSCTGPLRWRGRVDSYENPGVYSEGEVTTPALTGCDAVAFAPNLIVQPEPAQADSPTGLSIEILLPQTYEDPAGLAESTLKDTIVTLPSGVAVNPGSGDGLGACSEEEFGLHDAEETTCPNDSKIGTVEVTTPLLPNPLRGAIYLAQQGNLPGNGTNPFGSLLALYLQIKDPISGTLVKLAGEVKPDPESGQLVTTFLNNPPVPLERLKLSFTAGPRAAIVNPPLCGNYVASSEMTPWSGGQPATPDWAVPITSGPAGAPCSATEPFDPQLVSGTTSNQAGAYTPYSLTFFRKDGEQNLGRIQIDTPPGLTGNLTGIPLCPEPQATQGKCSPESQIGTMTVGVGAGSNPFYDTGKIYLTGPYNGAPFGLSIVVPAVAGPLNLGTVVVRASVNINPTNAALTVTSEPLPQILQGVPLHIKAVNVTMNREHFIFNPTDCEPLAVDATMTSALGAIVPQSTRFQVTNCARLAFEPKFTVTTSGQTSRAAGASLDARLTQPQLPQGGQVNIAKFKVELPKALPSRLSTLQQACLASVFEVNPAKCPPASIVGYAKAYTPILPVELTGPAYFVSHGGEAFPSLIIVLQGYGVRINLVGSTFISPEGVTSSTFGEIPDVPVLSFELFLPEGPYSALTAHGNLCEQTLRMPTEIVAADGADVIHQATPIGVTGCAKAGAHSAHVARRARASRHRRRAQAARRAALHKGQGERRNAR